MQRWFLTLGSVAVAWATLTTAALAHGRIQFRQPRHFIHSQRAVRSGRYFAPNYTPHPRRVILIRPRSHYYPAPQRYYRYH